MKVAGFSFVRNALKYDYPIVEAIQSILSICDIFVIAVGKSEDETLSLIRSINSDKIKIIETVWDDSLREGGRVLAVETDKAFQAIPEEYDWAFYIQGDEVVHEEDLPVIRAAMEKNLNRKEIDGLLFKYRHFFGSYDYVGSSLRWYLNEIRVVRNNKSIYSFRDAQGFRKGNDKMLNVVAIPAYINHYGWVKDPRVMQAKQEHFHKLWHNDEWMEENIPKVEEFDYFSNIDTLKRFTGSHPKAMQERIDKVNWKFDYDISFNRESLKQKAKRLLKKIGWDTTYRNYILKK
ncbi:MAG: glycosyltransferase family 2 protein [Flavobacteriia bacterium]|nr:glycosyltransferase family 2 protein [Flavobacteriia bacterium]OJX38508.1 MAG: glycosyl transferase [Flavobacteriia bacterium 40-80]